MAGHLHSAGDIVIPCSCIVGGINAMANGRLRRRACCSPGGPGSPGGCR